MDKPAGHYSVFRVPFQIDADGDCTRCGLKIEPDEDTLEPHECPPGFTDPAMSWSKGLKRYNGVEQDDEGAYVYYDEHIAALRRAKVEGLGVWTSQRPSEPGYYWWRDTDEDGMVTHYPRPVHVWKGRERPDEDFQVYTSLTGLPVDIKLVKDVWGEWAGPIKFPLDARAAQIEEGEQHE